VYHIRIEHQDSAHSQLVSLPLRPHADRAAKSLDDHKARSPMGNEVAAGFERKEYEPQWTLAKDRDLAVTLLTSMGLTS